MDHASVAYVIPLSQNRPGFAVPVLRASSQSNALYYQVIDHRGRIIALEACRPLEHQLLATPEPFVEAVVGGEQLHAVISPDGEVVVGRREELAPRVRAWINIPPHPLSRLALAEFCADGLGKGAAAQEAFSEMVDGAGQRSGRRWFVDAVLAPRVIRAVSRKAALSLGEAELDRLMERIVISVDRDVLRVDLPAELIKEDGAWLDGPIPALDDVVALARPLGVRKAAVFHQAAVQSRRGPPSSRPTAAVLIIGDLAVFQKLAASAPGRTPPEAKTPRHLLLATRADGIGVGFVDTAEGLRLSLTAFLAERTDVSDLLIVLTGSAYNAVAIGTELKQWRDGRQTDGERPAVTLALRFTEIAPEQGRLEEELVAINPDRAALSLANAWNARPGSREFGGSPARVVECLEGWVAAVCAGTWSGVLDLDDPSKGFILTAAAEPEDGRDPTAQAAAAVANPLWPDVWRADLTMAWGRRASRPVIDAIDRPHPPHLARYASVALEGAREPPERGMVIRALAIMPAFSGQDEAALEAYVEERLTFLGWAVRSTGSVSADMLATIEGAPPVWVSVKRTAGDAWHQPNLTGNGQWHAFVVGETLRTGRHHSSKQIIGFDRLDDLAHIAREHEAESARPAQLIRVSPYGSQAFNGAKLQSGFVIPPDLALKCLARDPGHHPDLMSPVLSGRDIVQFPQLNWTFDLWDDPRDYPEWVFNLLRSRAMVRWTSQPHPRLPKRVRALEERPRYLVTAVAGRRRLFMRCRGPIAVASTAMIYPYEPDWLLAILSSRAHAVWAEAVASNTRGNVRYSSLAAASFPLPEGLVSGASEGLADELSRLGDALSHARFDWQYDEIHPRRPVLDADFLRTLTLQTSANDLKHLANVRSLTRLYDDNPLWLAEIHHAIDRAVFAAYGLSAAPSDGDVIERLHDLNASGGAGRLHDLL